MREPSCEVVAKMDVRRGFHRIGIVLAAPFALAALIFVGIAVFTWATPPDKNGPWEKYAAEDEGKWKDNPFADLIPAGPKAQKADALKPSADFQRRKDAREGLMFSLLLGIVALVLYGVCVAIGWVINGFRT